MTTQTRGTQTKEARATELFEEPEAGGADMVTKERETEKAVIQVGAEERKITISFNDVREYLCPRASDAEIGLFLKVCSSEGLNPFKHECFLVKYADDQPAAIIIATETFLKSAEARPEYDGVEAGIIVKDAAGKLDFREGSFLLDEEAKNLVGGWAKAYRKDRARPIYAAVNIKECIKYTKSGRPTRFWDEMPATMVRKVALSRALREGFPNRFGGTLTTAEFEEIPEGQLPPALEKNGKPAWRKFWAKVKSELGLSPEAARLLLGVGSIKEELTDTGWTMERIWDEITKALQEKQASASPDGGTMAPEEVILEGEKKAEATAETGAKPASPKRAPETIRTINELMKACFEDFKMQPREVLKELGYSSQVDITELPGECYRRIAAVRG